MKSNINTTKKGDFSSPFSLLFLFLYHITLYISDGLQKINEENTFNQTAATEQVTAAALVLLVQGPIFPVLRHNL